MPPKTGPKCCECQKTESLLWRNVESGQICQECYEQKESKAQENTEEHKETPECAKDVKEMPEKASAVDEKRLRKSTRATRFKAKPHSATTTTTAAPGNGGNHTSSAKAQKGRNRRNLFKKTPFKTPVAQATTHVVDSVFFKGSYLQVGDIVSLVDHDSNVYYAQIRGLLVDNYCEKSAYLTWLIPTQASPHPNEGFDAATYLIGPDEDLSRKLSCLEFVMHAPSNYYLDRTTPYPLPDSMEFEKKPGGYIWTNLQEYQRKKVVS